jgi:hypothetical protein
MGEELKAEPKAERKVEPIEEPKEEPMVEPKVEPKAGANAAKRFGGLAEEMIGRFGTMLASKETRGFATAMAQDLNVPIDEMMRTFEETEKMIQKPIAPETKPLNEILNVEVVYAPQLTAVSDAELVPPASVDEKGERRRMIESFANKMCQFLRDDYVPFEKKNDDDDEAPPLPFTTEELAAAKELPALGRPAHRRVSRAVELLRILLPRVLSSTDRATLPVLHRRMMQVDETGYASSWTADALYHHLTCLPGEVRLSTGKPCTVCWQGAKERLAQVLLNVLRYIMRCDTCSMVDVSMRLAAEQVYEVDLAHLIRMVCPQAFLIDETAGTIGKAPGYQHSAAVIQASLMMNAIAFEMAELHLSMRCNMAMQLDVLSGQ